MKTEIVKTYVHHNGGFNNLLIAYVMYGFATLAAFTGRGALKRAIELKRKLMKTTFANLPYNNKGITELSLKTKVNLLLEQNTDY